MLLGSPHPSVLQGEGCPLRGLVSFLSVPSSAVRGGLRKCLPQETFRLHEVKVSV